MDQNIIKLQHFFTADIKIKKEMIDLAPVNYEGIIDEDSMVKYTDKLYDSLKYMFSELKSIALDMYGENSNVLERICSLEYVAMNKFYECGLDINKLKAFYMIFVSDMSIDFIDSVKKECVGYTLFNGTLSASKANSVNEMLHFIHSSIINNENILQSIPLVSQKMNNEENPICLRGLNSQMAYGLIENWPVDLSSGIVDIISLSEDKIIVMVRDRGHALSIEVSINKDMARVEYFIPKLCNIEMINNLPGVNRVNESMKQTTGAFETKKDNLINNLITFVSKVPTDEDIIIEDRVVL